jgi:ABC-type sugar transport system substrate-binding protein
MKDILRTIFLRYIRQTSRSAMTFVIGCLALLGLGHVPTASAGAFEQEFVVVYADGAPWRAG